MSSLSHYSHYFSHNISFLLILFTVLSSNLEPYMVLSSLRPLNTHQQEFLVSVYMCAKCTLAVRFLTNLLRRATSDVSYKASPACHTKRLWPVICHLEFFLSLLFLSFFPLSLPSPPCFPPPPFPSVFSLALW